MSFLSFFLSSTTLSSSGILRGMTDFHSHLLPGVDDGVKTLPETLEVLEEMERQGVAEVWFTPHIMEDIPNTPAALRQRFSEVQAAYRGNVSLRLAAEHMLDLLFEERLAADDLLPIELDGRRCLLLETSCFNPPMGLPDVLQRIRQKGYHPLLAHPERYEYMSASDYRQLKSAGILFQLNLPALGGMYGKGVQKKAEALLKAGMYDCMGCDVHSANYLRYALQSGVGKVALAAKGLSRYSPQSKQGQSFRTPGNSR